MSNERLTTARLSLSRLLEIYTPIHAGRDAALKALQEGVERFERAIREDESAWDEAAIRADERAKLGARASLTDEELETVQGLRNGTLRALPVVQPGVAPAPLAVPPIPDENASVQRDDGPKDMSDAPSRRRK